jgi:hypothetical protein
MQALLNLIKTSVRNTEFPKFNVDGLQHFIAGEENGT